MFFLGYISKLKHLIQYKSLSLFIGFGIAYGGIFGRVLRYSRNAGTFCQVKLADLFAKVIFGCGAYTVKTMVKTYGIQIKFQNVVLSGFLAAKGFFKLSLIFNGKILFLNLTGDFFIAGKHFVFNKLLSNCTCTLREVTFLYINNERSEYTFDIYTVMLIETFVLNCNNGMLKVFGYLVKGYILSVFLAMKLVYLNAVIIIYDGSIVAWNDVRSIKFWCVFYYAYPDADTNSYYS